MATLSSTRQPLLWAALAYAAGILLANYLWRPPLWWLLAAVVFTLAAAWFRAPQGWRNVFARASAIVALAALGAWSLQASETGSVHPDLSPFLDQPVVVTGHVVRDGVLHGSGKWQSQSMDIETETIEVSGATTAVTAGLRLTVYGQTPAPEEEDASADEAATFALPPVFTYGQRLRFPISLRAPRNFQNPGSWDYRSYLLRQGIVASGSVAAKNIAILPGLSGSPLPRWCSRARRAVQEKIHLLWPRNKVTSATDGTANFRDDDQAALFDAMLIGERSLVDRETSAAWQRTGLYHLLVVSGLKVGILAFFVFGLSRWLRCGQWTASIATIAVAAGYAWLTELGTPVLRAVLMLAVFLVTRLLFRQRMLLNALGAAALVLLVADPRALSDSSFQLTFLAVLAIAGLAVPIFERTSQPYRRGLRCLHSPAYDISLPPRVAQFRLDLRLLSARMAALLPAQRQAAQRWTLWLAGHSLGLAINIYEVMVISAVAQVATTLPMAFYFHRATVVGLAANTLALPLTGILMTSSAVALGLAFVWLPLAKVPALLAGWSLAATTTVVRVLGGMRLADFRMATPSPTQLLVATSALAVALLLMRRRAVLALLGLALLLGTTLWITLAPPPAQLQPGVMEVTAIDVGQGDSLLVVTPEGRTLLIDAGGPLGPFQSNLDFGENVVAPYLWSRGITHLDALVLTHPHSDHMGGMPSVLTIFHPQELWLSTAQAAPQLARLRSLANSMGVHEVTRILGERFTFGGADFEVLAPPADWQATTEARNNDSLVLRISYRHTSALLTGDVETKVARYLAQQQPRADLLKVAHHGGLSSTTPELLEVVHPRFAVISVGAHNHFHHPRFEVLERLQQAHVVTYRTDVTGAVTFTLDGNRVTAKPAILN